TQVKRRPDHRDRCDLGAGRLDRVSNRRRVAGGNVADRDDADAKPGEQIADDAGVDLPLEVIAYAELAAKMGRLRSRVAQVTAKRPLQVLLRLRYHALIAERHAEEQADPEREEDRDQRDCVVSKAEQGAGESAASASEQHLEL